MGGVRWKDFPIWSEGIPAAAFRLSRVLLFVVAVLALISKVLRVEADLRVIAVLVVQPYGMMHDLSEPLPAYLTDAAVLGFPHCDEGRPGSPPGHRPVEARLRHGPPSCLQKKRAVPFGRLLMLLLYHILVYHSIPSFGFPGLPSCLPFFPKKFGFLFSRKVRGCNDCNETNAIFLYNPYKGIYRLYMAYI